MLQTGTARLSVMDSPTRYLIRVIGELDKRWLGYFDEISIAVCVGTGPITVSTICTHHADQAAVFGLLNSLYDFGYPVIYFEKL